MRDLAEAEPASSRSHGERPIAIFLYANFYDVCMLLLPTMGLSSEDYHVNAQAQSVPRQSDFPTAIFDLRYRLDAQTIYLFFIVGRVFGEPWEFRVRRRGELEWT
jgi:hypothetical protein